MILTFFAVRSSDLVPYLTFFSPLHKITEPHELLYPPVHGGLGESIVDMVVISLNHYTLV
ncbi:hypothetical protein MetMK1DRAFT_00018390 [Metallosphaera yellowstonensis MK1]|uniref:Uncharacterized protein n=1 Tax=Metallosphaera yellowstonensis MK1 TaxID=671065 RepID=H2C5L6_9CREN|nr:hypothetical protein MetMK1DRAFT_00018390 [Metallosphaera yellowstonensis MK1]